MALGYSNASKAVIIHVDDEDKQKKMLETGSQNGNVVTETTLINESGLYSLIMSSKLPSAKKFKHWVTHDVLPQIRKTGSYRADGKPASYMIEDPAERARRWAEEYEEKKALESKAHIFDQLIDSKLLVNFRDAAKELGISQSQFTGWLKDSGYVYANSKGELRPMEPYMESGFFQMKAYTNPFNGFSGSRTLITPRGLAAFKMILEDSGHSRETMQKHGGRGRHRKGA